MEKLSGWMAQKVDNLRQSRFLTHSGRKVEKEKARFLLENGSILLEELISSCKGTRCRCNPIRSFSAKELMEATNRNPEPAQYNLDPLDGWFRGTLDDRPVLIKKCHPNFIGAYRDIAIGSKMSSHKNVLKLLGCCLELSGPVLVYEYPENGPLNITGGIQSKNLLSLSWTTRLRVAKDIANAITYLHTAFPRPIIHRDIKPENIFLDKDCVPKLCDFSLSISIPEGETHVEDAIMGTLGFLDPDYAMTSFVTEHTDVFSFGVLLVVLVTGQRAVDHCRGENEIHIRDYVANFVENERVNEIVDPMILDEGGNDEERKLQVQAFVELAMSCVEIKRENRPLMIDVARELVEIEKSTRNFPSGN